MITDTRTVLSCLVRAAEIMSLVLLVVAVLARSEMAPVGPEDFCNYYMGGAVALSGSWDDLYPTPVPGVNSHPGYPHASKMKPGYEMIATNRGVGDTFRFIYPPPAALLFVPLATMDLEAATVVWRAILILACWLTGVVAGRLYGSFAGGPTYTQAAIVIVAVCSPLSLASVRVANTSPLAAAGLALFTLSASTRRHSWVGGMGFYVGVLLKYAPAPLLLVPAVLRDWRLFVRAVGITVATTAAVLPVCGTAPVLEFAKIAPLFRHVTPGLSNMSLQSFCILASPDGRLQVPTKVLVTAQIGAFVAIAITMVAAVRRGLPAQRIATAGASGLIAWLLIFAPSAGAHYFTYLVPFWGWYVWESRKSWAGLVTAVIVIGGTWLPLGGSGRVNLPLWLNHHMLWAAVTAYLFSIGLLALSGATQKTK